jgi:hypothetical protein
MARVYVSDEVWAEFRASAYPRSLNFVLGELVRREVERYHSRRVREGLVDDRELIEALDRARDFQEDLVAIIARLERLGATWPPPAEFPP